MIYKKSWKYILIKASCLDDLYFGYRPKAVKKFSDVYIGRVGGYVHGYHNLSQSGNCWIYCNAIVSDNAQVTENACIYEEARICENAKVYGNAKVSGHAYVYGYAKVYGNANIENNTVTCGDVK